jgi:hypothetical protein
MFWEGNKKIDDSAELNSDSIVIEKPRMPQAPKRLTPHVDANVMAATALAEYREVAAAVGISAQDLLVEEFRVFLSEHDIPTFNLGEVVSYMDEIAAKDNPTGLGWHWCPVRAKDAEIPLTFGRASREDRYSDASQKTPASDFYESHRFEEWHGRGQGGWSGGGSFSMMGSSSNMPTVHVESNLRLMQAAHDETFQRPPQRADWRTMTTPAYTRTLPLHALKKIALVEKNFKAGPVVFLVTDYCMVPHIVVNPDPFLMAIIPNSAVAHGKGRFIIDVWDEPGFGIERMVK